MGRKPRGSNRTVFVEPCGCLAARDVPRGPGSGQPPVAMLEFLARSAGAGIVLRARGCPRVSGFGSRRTQGAPRGGWVLAGAPCAASAPAVSSWRWAAFPPPAVPEAGGSAVPAVPDFRGWMRRQFRGHIGCAGCRASPRTAGSPPFFFGVLYSFSGSPLGIAAKAPRTERRCSSVSRWIRAKFGVEWSAAAPCFSDAPHLVRGRNCAALEAMYSSAAMFGSRSPRSPPGRRHPRRPSRRAAHVHGGPSVSRARPASFSSTSHWSGVGFGPACGARRDPRSPGGACRAATSAHVLRGHDLPAAGRDAFAWVVPSRLSNFRCACGCRKLSLDLGPCARSSDVPWGG